MRLLTEKIRIGKRTIRSDLLSGACDITEQVITRRFENSKDPKANTNIDCKTDNRI